VNNKTIDYPIAIEKGKKKILLKHTPTPQRERERVKLKSHSKESQWFNDRLNKWAESSIMNTISMRNQRNNPNAMTAFKPIIGNNPNEPPSFTMPNITNAKPKTST